MEQVLDAFFRDHGKRAELATLGKDSLQIRGALRMLEQDDAERLLGLCQGQIDSYANPDTPVGDEDLELLAESLSGLGFFVEAFEQQRPNRQRLIAPLLAKRLGEAPPALGDGGAETVEDAVEDLRSALPTLVAEIRRAPADAAARAELTAKLKDLVDDATLIDDAELVGQAEAALAELASGGTMALEAAVTAIAESGATGVTPAPAVSAETQRLLAVDAKGLDAELLDIYLIEAAEVLDTVAANRGTRAEPGRSRGIALGTPAVSHAERQWPDGRPHGARRARLGRRAGPQPAARGGARGLARGARADRSRGNEFQALDRSPQGHGQRRRRSCGTVCRDRPGGSRASCRRRVGAAGARRGRRARAGADSGPRCPSLAPWRIRTGSRAAVDDEAVEAGPQPAVWVAAIDDSEDVGTGNRQSSRPSAQCPPARCRRSGAEPKPKPKLRHHPMSSRLAMPGSRPTSSPSWSTRRRPISRRCDTSFRCCNSIPRCCRPRPWCARAIRCAGFTARAICR
jgi:hypothetical protein